MADEYFGVRVADPYRWLEEADSAETIAWVDAQNAVTRSRLDGPLRDELVARLTTLYDFPAASVPRGAGSITSTPTIPGCRINRCSTRRMPPAAPGVSSSIRTAMARNVPSRSRRWL